MSSNSHLVSLANAIQSRVTELQKNLAASGQPDPSFEHNAPIPDFNAPGVQDIRISVLEQIEELHDLLLTPLELLHGTASTDFISRHALDRFNIYDLIPVGETRSYAQLAESTNLPTPIVRRIVRHAMTQRIFCEPSPDMVTHTAASKLITEDVPVRDYFGTLAQIVYPSAAQTAHALHTWPKEAGSNDRTKSGFQLTFGKTTYQLLEEDKRQHERYDSAMSANRDNMMYSVEHIAKGFDWGSLGHGKIVDVAGGIGSVSRELAGYFPDLTFTVQDRPEVVDNAISHYGPGDDLRDRVSIMQHDMFTPQPVKHADVYFFRRVFMEWSDDKAIDILRNLVPAMEPGKSRVIIADIWCPEHGDCPLWLERRFRNSDMIGLALSNGGPRDKNAWVKLFHEADAGYIVKSVKGLKNSDMMITEAVWEGK